KILVKSQRFLHSPFPHHQKAHLVHQTHRSPAGASQFRHGLVVEVPVDPFDDECATALGKPQGCGKAKSVMKQSEGLSENIIVGQAANASSCRSETGERLAWSELPHPMNGKSLIEGFRDGPSPSAPSRSARTTKAIDFL